MLLFTILSRQLENFAGGMDSRRFLIVINRKFVFTGDRLGGFIQVYRLKNFKRKVSENYNRF